MTDDRVAGNTRRTVRIGLFGVGLGHLGARIAKLAAIEGIACVQIC